MQRREYLKTMGWGALASTALLDACSSPTPSLSAEVTAEAPAETGPLSARGVLAASSPTRVDMDLYFEAAANLFNKSTNPNGAFPLNVAESRLVWPLLRDKITEVSRKYTVEDWVAGYTSSVGSPSTREVMAAFLSKFLTGCPINPEHLCMSPGAAAVIEMSTWVLASAGDVAVIPAPCYPVYKQDIGNRPGLERYDLITHREMSELKNGPLLSTDHLDAAWKDISAKGKRFRMLIITNPDNPTGGMYTKEQFHAYADWCVAHQVHLMVNEIYGLSLIDTNHEALKGDYPGPQTFYSFANIINERKSDYLHLWYALSKDFGVSGFRVGLVYSLNSAFRSAYNNLNPPTMVSNYAQWIFEKVLSDEVFVANYIRENQRALTANYAVAVERLRKLNIPYAPARGSLFVWLDMSEFLKSNTQEEETAMWTDLYKKSGVLVTPGNGFGHEKRGQFRLVYSYVAKDDLMVAMDRLAKYVEDRRKGV